MPSGNCPVPVWKYCHMDLSGVLMGVASNPNANACPSFRREGTFTRSISSRSTPFSRTIRTDGLFSAMHSPAVLLMNQLRPRRSAPSHT